MMKQFEQLNSVWFALSFFFVLLGFACKKEKIIESYADFNYEISNQNLMVPVQVRITNTSIGAKYYEWTFENGHPNMSDKKNPGVVQFDIAGTHKIKLRALNDDNESIREIELKLDSSVQVDFEPITQTNEFSPVEVYITNKTVGATNFNWVFEGGIPQHSTAKYPPPIKFLNPGDHNITLTVSSGNTTFSKTKKIYVGPALQPSFKIIPSFEDDDFEAPFRATVKNTTVSGLNYNWSISGGSLSDVKAKEPDIYFENAGTYTLTLVADNGKETQIYTQTITVLPNQNLQTFRDIRLGINTAHSTIGSFFSSSLKRVFKKDDNLTINGKDIDFVYFGLNQNFIYNKILSPDAAADYSFNAISGALKTEVINLQENCDCGGVIMSSADFDNLTNGASFQKYSNHTVGASQKHFTNGLIPRIVRYQTADGRMGAIKIKQFVVNGTQSYIVVDIKVQKSK